MSGYNDTIDANGRKVIFEQGYWTFDMIQKKFTHEDLGDLTANYHNQTCTINAKTNINLGNFGELFGFKKDTKIRVATQGDSTILKSPNKVEINRGLRFVEVFCNLVNIDRNFNRHGQRSSVIATLPISESGKVNGVATQYFDTESRTYLLNGIYDQMSFTVQGNNDSMNIGSVLLDIYIGIE